MDDTGIDRETMGRLAGTLAFLRGGDDPFFFMLRLPPASTRAPAIRPARALFLKLKPAERRSALAGLAD
jgi:hypothetical protein